MGGIIYYGSMLPVNRHEHPQKLDGGERQLEVLTQAQKIHVRLGPVGAEKGVTDRYTAELTLAEARELLEGLNSAIGFLEYESLRAVCSSSS